LPPSAHAANLSLGGNEPSRLPDGVRSYVVGDIHGRFDLLQKTFDKIDEHNDRAPIAEPLEIYVGDYVDRGPNSREVVEAIMRRASRKNVIALVGNHEEYLLQSLSDPNVFQDWLRHGGRETLISYCGTAPLHPNAREIDRAMRALNEAVPREQIEFLEQLPLNHRCGDYLFVHAGVRPNVSIAQQKASDMLWIRREFTSYTGLFPLMIVHGHTPVRQPEVRANRINIDTGAYATGRLTCMVLEGSRLSFL